MKKRFYKLNLIETINAIPVDCILELNAIYGTEFVIEGGKITGWYINGGK